MNKTCMCGVPMHIHQSTLIYKRRLFIEHVPIWNCSQCQSNGMMSFLKDELISLIQDWQYLRQKQIVQFDEWSEKAKILLRVIHLEVPNASYDHMVSQRINELLDELILVKSLKDEQWTKDIHRRLFELTSITVE